MPRKPPKLRTAYATLPLILSIMTRSSFPIFLSSVPYTAVPSTLSLAIKETVSFDSRIVAVVIEVPFIASGSARLRRNRTLRRYKCGAWVEFRRTHRNPISSDEQSCATGSIASERLYVRDDRPFGRLAPPAAAFYYSCDRAGEHPQAHLAIRDGPAVAERGLQRHPPVRIKLMHVIVERAS